MDETGPQESTRLLRRPAEGVRKLGHPGAAALVRELARAKAELARELEANLKQLREVLEQTERIARDMERVLAEVRAPAVTEARGSEGGDRRGERGEGARR